MNEEIIQKSNNENNNINKEFRLLEVIPKGQFKKVQIIYYDTNNLEKFIKIEEDAWEHITPTTEINYKAYGYKNLDSLIEQIKPLFPGRFETKSYGSNNKWGDYNDSSFYRESQETGIIWYLGDRKDRKELEFFIDDEHKKQIFIRNGTKRFKARTRILPNEKIAVAKEYLEKELKPYKEYIDSININEKAKYVEVKCEEKLLKFLNPVLFRINVYESKEFKDEDSANKLLEEIKRIPEFNIHVDRSKVIKIRKGPFDFKHIVRLTSDENNSFNETILNKGLKKSFEKYGKNIRKLKAREELWDPLFLNSPTQQLRDFFPSHMIYDPKKNLKEQLKDTVPKFEYFKAEESELEQAINSAYNFYTKKSVIIDLEVTDYNKEKEISGRIFMAVLNSNTENKIYMTKEAWKNNKNYFKNKTKTELVFVDDEIDLIGILNKDCEKYEYVIGHNFIDYDQKHLTKFNDENSLFNQGKITIDEKTKIKNWKKKNETKRLWMKTRNKLLDTYKYVKTRIHLLQDYKLSTFAGFNKSIDYEEMEMLLKSGKPENIQKIINYTIEDGFATKKITDNLLKTAVIESFAFNKSFASSFSNKPFKNFYDACSRDYFMKLHTYKHRHEFSPLKNFEKLEARKNPNELIYELIKKENQNIGIVEGLLMYPDAVIESCKNIIFNNQVTKKMYEEMLTEKNTLVKVIYLNNLHSFLHVAVDKIKNFMEIAGLEFGKKYEIHELFTTLNKEDLIKEYDGLREGDINLGDRSKDIPLRPKLENETFFEEKNLNEIDRENIYFKKDNHEKKELSDFELSRTNFIFSAEYGIKRLFVRKGLIPYDYTMLKLNNDLADNMKEMNNKLIAKTQSLYITSENIGYSLGKVKGINFKDKGFIGILNNYHVYLNRRKHKDLLIKEMIEYFLDNDVSYKEMRNKFSEKLYKQKPEYWNKHRDYIYVLSGLDLKKSGGTRTLDLF